jgi:hypothetical protein
MATPETFTPYEVDELEQELLATDRGEGNGGDWYAIHTDPWPCPACGEEFTYVTACHHVIVAPDRDDLLDHAVACSRHGRNPRIVRYDDKLPTMTLFQWRALGRPVHGIKKAS